MRALRALGNTGTFYPKFRSGLAATLVRDHNGQIIGGTIQGLGTALYEEYEGLVPDAALVVVQVSVFGLTTVPASWTAA